MKDETTAIDAIRGGPSRSTPVWLECQRWETEGGVLTRQLASVWHLRSGRRPEPHDDLACGAILPHDVARIEADEPPPHACPKCVVVFLSIRAGLSS